MKWNNRLLLFQLIGYSALGFATYYGWSSTNRGRSVAGVVQNPVQYWDIESAAMTVFMSSMLFFFACVFALLNLKRRVSALEVEVEALRGSIQHVGAPATDGPLVRKVPAQQVTGIQNSPVDRD